MNNRNVPNPNKKSWTEISGMPIPIFLRLIQGKGSKKNTQSQEQKSGQKRIIKIMRTISRL
jgi:hypothetical protein